MAHRLINLFLLKRFLIPSVVIFGHGSSQDVPNSVMRENTRQVRSQFCLETRWTRGYTTARDGNVTSSALGIAQYDWL